MMVGDDLQDYEQLSLELDQHLGQPILFPMDTERVGGNLLPILSKGLYTESRHCVREYVQNGVDAGAKEVRIKITGNSIIIHDNGHGMTLESLMDARDFAISGKDFENYVGFRGIGIYSGFDLCNRLLITTKTQGEDHGCVLEFDFKSMKAQLASERQAPRSKRTPLTTLITNHSTFKRELGTEPEELHYTTVQLEDVSPVHIEPLSDRRALTKYIIQNLPIDFAEDFPFREELRKELERNIPGYNAVTIVLESDTQDPEIITRPSIANLGRPKAEYIRNKETNRPVAFYWATLHQGRTKIPDAYADYRGLVYKVKGFTIGDSHNVKKLFPKRGGGAHFDWYTGEVFVLDPEVIPNTERNGFETNHAKTQMEAAVRAVLRDLDLAADKHRTSMLAQAAFTEAYIEYLKIKAGIDSGTAGNLLEVYKHLGDLLEDLESRKSKVLPRTWKSEGEDGKTPAEIIEVIRQLETTVLHAINNPALVVEDIDDEFDSSIGDDESRISPVFLFPDATSPDAFPPATDVVRREIDGLTPHTTGDRDGGGDTDNATSRGPLSRSDQEKVPPGVDGQLRTSSLLAAIENAGWRVDEDCARMIHIVDACAADILAPQLDLYDDFLSMVEARLSAETMS